MTMYYLFLKQQNHHHGAIGNQRVEIGPVVPGAVGDLDHREIRALPKCRVGTDKLTLLCPRIPSAALSHAATAFSQDAKALCLNFR